MIEIQVRIHDKFSIEFKTGYLVKNKPDPEKFALNTWLFVPNSLDINAQSYSKDQFYRDVKSNVRLITPVFLLREIATGPAVPFNNLRDSFSKVASSPSRTAMSDYEYEIKMFMAIFKSSIRDEIAHMINNPLDTNIEFMFEEYLKNVNNITSTYRDLCHIINVPTVTSDILNMYMFGDEFMSNIIEKHTFVLIRNIKARYGKKYEHLIDSLSELIIKEKNYRKDKGFPVVETESQSHNREVVFRHSVLKKYIESDLFLQAQKKRDGVAMEQIYLSIAAGLSMIFATAVAFSFQQKYGNFTMPLFVALVVSYMLKDRIKDLMRYYFAHRLKAKYFDNKTTISIKDQPIGWIKEGVDFITEDKVLEEVMDIRSRSPLLKAENRINDEKIILYRKLVEIDSELLKEEDKYQIKGINDIVRLHLSSFIQKMDNPEVPLNSIDKDGNIRLTSGDKIYYLNFVIQMQHDEQIEYKRFRVVLNRLGIIEIEELK